MDTSKFEPPNIVASVKVFEGRVFDVTVDTIREADKTYTREVVHHHGSAVILPAFDDGTIALVRQGGLSAFAAADAACVYLIVKGFKPYPLLSGADSGPVARGAGSGPATLASY